MRRIAGTIGLAMFVGTICGCQDPNKTDDIQDGESQTALMPPDFYTTDPAESAGVDDYSSSGGYTDFPADTASSGYGGGDSWTASSGGSSQPVGRSSGGATHRVAKGDTLYRLARLYYNDPSRWKEIHAANKGLVPNPNVLKVGQELVIP